VSNILLLQLPSDEEKKLLWKTRLSRNVQFESKNRSFSRAEAIIVPP
jgi:hypothetical protein